jgi:hypothetical protein
VTKALHKLLYAHVDRLDKDAERTRVKAEEDRKYLENNEDFLYFTVNGSAWGYDMDAKYTATELGLDNAIASFKQGFERTENGPTLYKGEWQSGGQIRTIHVYVKLAHSVIEVPPSIYQRRLPKEMKGWVKRALAYKKRQADARNAI